MRYSFTCKLACAALLALLASCEDDVVFGGGGSTPAPSGSPTASPGSSVLPTVSPTTSAGFATPTAQVSISPTFTPSATPTSIDPFGNPTDILNTNAANPAGISGTAITSTAAFASPTGTAAPTPTPVSTSVVLNAVVDDNGKASLSFSVPADSTKFAVAAAAPDNGYVRFTEAGTESGVNYFDPQSLQISLAGRQSHFINEISVPSRSTDPAIKSADTFLVTVETFLDASGTAAVGKTTTFTITSEADPDLNNGTMLVNVFFVGTAAATDSSKSVIRQALQHFAEVYAAAGVTVQISEKEIAGPQLLPSPIEGDSFYAAESSQVMMPALNLFVGEDISGNVNAALLGLSPGIPGPPIPSPRSALAVALLAGAGPSGVYDTEKIRILGETIAHETGHYLGLFHPVEIVNGEAAGTDPLSDTPVCSTANECLNNGNLISNLMFPIIVFGSDGKAVPQFNLTAEQRGVINRYIAVN